MNLLLLAVPNLAPVCAAPDASAAARAAWSAPASPAGGYTREWAWDARGPNTVVSGSVRVDENDFVEVPGLVWARADGGMVDAWVRDGGAWQHVVADAPVDLAFSAVVSGKSGVLCARGGADEPGLRFSTAATTVAGAPVDGPGPAFGACGCR